MESKITLGLDIKIPWYSTQYTQDVQYSIPDTTISDFYAAIDAVNLDWKGYKKIVSWVFDRNAVNIFSTNCGLVVSQTLFWTIISQNHGVRY